ncbi:MAG: nicotinate (nicotinamide) nucleotide adenylyltransferase [Hylemonella sp.]|nr:nicotinate (nicotinamide) nucleotide adenylyltransferase [Hylemonella sp.]
MTPAKRLGMFGGAFDPPHLAHRALAEAALAELQLDELHIMPTGQAWHKSRPLTGAHHRLAMARLAFEGLPKVSLDEREIHRAGPSYTLDTLRELHAEQPQAEVYLIMGKDQADVLPSWRDWQEIVQLAIICVADRDGLTGEETRFMPPAEMTGRFRKLHMPSMDISATGIRTRVASSQGIAPLVSASVARYIEEHHLYRNT